MTSELVGQTLGSRYRFDALLGEGTFARVFRVTDLHRNAMLAAKVLRRDIAGNPTFVERFQREAAVLARLQHPHIVRYYETVDLDGFTFLLLDYIPGETLDSVLARRAEPLKPSASFTVLAPLASALHFAHHEGVIHRDLKPANVLIHENGTVYITDFGIARLLDVTSQLTLGMTVGTPLYMSPEQITGAPVTPAADIYALGVMLYRMYTGVAPFRGENPRASGTTTSARITYEHVHMTPEPPASVNPQLPLAVQEVILRCLEKDPQRRFSAVAILYDALAEAVGLPPLAVEAPPVPEDTPAAPLKPPEWSSFMRPVAGPRVQKVKTPISTDPPLERIEHPIPLPPTRPHLEDQIREAAHQTLVSHGHSESLRTLPSMSRVLSYQASAPPGYAAPASRSRRRWGLIFAALGIFLALAALCAVAYYLAP